jgi:hypothetical protein
VLGGKTKPPVGAGGFWGLLRSRFYAFTSPAAGGGKNQKKAKKQTGESIGSDSITARVRVEHLATRAAAVGRGYAPISSINRFMRCAKAR